MVAASHGKVWYSRKTAIRDTKTLHIKKMENVQQQYRNKLANQCILYPNGHTKKDLLYLCGMRRIISNAITIKVLLYHQV